MTGLEVVAAGSVDNAISVNMPLPPESQPGDLLVFLGVCTRLVDPSGWTYFGGPDAGGNPNDMQPYYRFVDGSEPPGGWAREGDPTSGFSFLTWGMVWACFRNVGQVFGTSLHEGGTGSPLEMTTYPAQAGHATLAVVQTQVTTVVAGFLQADQTGQWDGVAQVPAGYTSGTILTYETEPPRIEHPPPGRFDTPPIWQYAMLSLEVVGESPPTRLWPRDADGLAAAPRLYPPPRGRRVVGGQL